MFIAMNRFRVIKGEEKAFEDLWLHRESHLDQMPGFVEFHMLRGPTRDDHTLYSSHTVWSDKDQFTAWTTSQQFRSAHGGAASTRQMYLGHPEFEGFDVIQTIASSGATRAPTAGSASIEGAPRLETIGKTKRFGSAWLLISPIDRRRSTRNVRRIETSFVAGGVCGDVLHSFGSYIRTLRFG